MKGFQYVRPASIDEACELKARHGSSAQFIAGGTDLLLEWRSGAATFDCCIDLTYVPELRHLSVSEDEIAFGPLTTLAEIAEAEGGDPLLACLSRAAGHMCTPQLRSTATIGGNICHASPCADMAVLLTCFDATATLRSVSGERSVSMGEFFAGVNETVLGVDELLTGISIPIPAARTEAAYGRATRVSTDLAQASAAVRISTEDDADVSAAQIVIGACAPVPVSSRAAGELLVGMSLVDPDRATIELAAERAEWETSPISDIRCSDEYRREVSKVLVRRAIDEALGRLSAVPAGV
jgi:aerobic carbon-monoxide dehydrogenase medium subunit